MRLEANTSSEWERRLHAMAEIGRASKHQAFKAPLALLGLEYLQRRDRRSPSDASGEPLDTVLRLAEDIEERRGLRRHSLSQHLLSGLSSIESYILDGWLRIASENWPIEGFAEWFAAKLDELDLAGHHDTPSSLSRLVASLFADLSPRTIFDPACGTGGLLAAMAEKGRKAELFGQEISSEALAWAELRFLIRGLGNIKLAAGNALTDQAFARLMPKDGFDLVLTNPPFGNLDAHTTALLSRSPNNLIAGLSGHLSSETAYVQEILGSLSCSGVAAVIVPNGFLSRGGVDQKLREALVRDDVVQAIVGLPERLFSPRTTIETALLFLNRRKPDNQRGQVLLVDARRLGRREGIRNVLDEESTKRIRMRYCDWLDEEGFSKIVSFPELGTANFSFSPVRYVTPATRQATISPEHRRSRIAELDGRYAALCREYEALRLQLAQGD